MSFGCWPLASHGDTGWPDFDVAVRWTSAAKAWIYRVVHRARNAASQGSPPLRLPTRPGSSRLEELLLYSPRTPSMTWA